MMDPEDPSIPKPLPIESSDAAASLSSSDIELVKQGHEENPVHTLEEGDVGATSFPTVEEIRAMNPPHHSKRSRGCIYLAALVLLVAVVVGVSVGLSNNNSETSVNNPGGGLQDEERPTFFQIRSWLEDEGISDSAAFHFPGSPQNLAAQWLATEDLAGVPLPRVSFSDPSSPEGYMFVVRYVMALIYFQMNGDNWHTPVNFMTPQPICQWNGNSLAHNGQGLGVEQGGIWCDEDGIPTFLDLGTFVCVVVKYRHARSPLLQPSGLLAARLTINDLR